MKKKRNKILNFNNKKVILVLKSMWTLSSVLLYIIWLMFVTNNFYPVNNNNVTAVISQTSIKIIIWPITLIILFVFIMPIWVTKSYEILLITFGLSLLILIFQSLLLIGLYINKSWMLWLIINVLNFFFICFIFVLILKRKL